MTDESLRRALHATTRTSSSRSTATPRAIHQLLHARPDADALPRARLQGGGDDDDAVRHGRPEPDEPLPHRAWTPSAARAARRATRAELTAVRADARRAQRATSRAPRGHARDSRLDVDGLSRVRALAVNCGSSSLKYALFDGRDAEEREVVRGSIDRVGTVVADHAAAVHAMVDALDAKGIAPDVVGHRVVHGGSITRRRAGSTPGSWRRSRRWCRFAPLHLPPEILGIRTAAAALAEDRRRSRASIPRFTRRSPTSRDASPSRSAPRSGHSTLRISRPVVRVRGRVARRRRMLGRAVIAHLGNGASMAAVRDGHSVDTTMGFTPTAGLVMGTRAGDLDPGLLVYLVERKATTRRRSIASSTARSRPARRQRNDRRRARSPRSSRRGSTRRPGPRRVRVERPQVGRRDGRGARRCRHLVFTGGIGEHAAPVRAAIADGLGHLGVEIDAARNEANAPVISVSRARCTVHVVPTDEERIVARHARSVGASA